MMKNMLLIAALGMSCATELHGDTFLPWQDKVSALAQLDLCGARDAPCAVGWILSA